MIRKISKSLQLKEKNLKRKSKGLIKARGRKLKPLKQLLKNKRRRQELQKKNLAGLVHN
jgi:hypothetical protein